MADAVAAGSASRITIHSSGMPATGSLTPLKQITLPDGLRTVADLRLTNHTHREAKRDSSCQVVLLQSVYKKVNEHLEQDTAREHGGFLFGFESTLGESNVPAVVVTDAIPARFTEGSPVRLIFTLETWRELDEEMARRYGSVQDAPQQVGWYHSHPNIRIFLSSWDLDVCTTYERRRYPLAVVADPIQDMGGCFVGGVQGYDPSSPQGFYEAHDLSADHSIVTWKNVSCAETRETRPGAGLETRGVEPNTAALQRTEDRGEEKGNDAKEGNEPHMRRAGVARGPLKIRIPLLSRVESVLWRFGSRALVVVLLGTIGYLLWMQRQDQAQLAKLQVLVQRSATKGSADSVSSGGLSAPPATDLVGAVQQTPAAVAATAHPEPAQRPPAVTSGVAGTVSVWPHEVKVPALQSRQFQASVQGTAKEREADVEWRIVPPSLGTLSRSGLYTAPKTFPENATVVVEARSVAHPKQLDRGRVELIKGSGAQAVAASTGSPVAAAPVVASGQAAAPKDGSAASAPGVSGGDKAVPGAPAFKVLGRNDVFAGQSVRFKAMAGDAPVDVTWTMDPATVGTISADGKYDAPPHVDVETPVKIVAIKVGDSASKDTLLLTIRPQAEAGHPDPDRL